MIEIPAPSMLVGYLDDDAATAASFTEHGYFKTSGLGYTFANGRFVYIARM